MTKAKAEQHALWTPALTADQWRTEFGDGPHQCTVLVRGDVVCDISVNGRRLTVGTDQLDFIPPPGKVLGAALAYPFDDVGPHAGLTKREYFAGLALQGLLASGEYDGEASFLPAKYAVKYTDALLEALARE